MTSRCGTLGAWQDPAVEQAVAADGGAAGTSCTIEPPAQRRPAAERQGVRQTRRILTRKEREQIGPFVVTREEDLDPRGISCAECGKLLATYDANGDCTQPSAEELVTMGAVAVPNFGWFCGPACGESYEQGDRHQVCPQFQRADRLLWR